MNDSIFKRPSSRRKVLLSCFTCSPHLGSEPGVGWRWLNEIPKRHDVVLVTHSYYRRDLEIALSLKPIIGLKIFYFSPTTFGIHPHTLLNSRIFYVWWQWNLKKYVGKLIKTESFDLIHHLTWGTFRFPTFLGRMGVPLVMGPLGGGEVAPMKLYAGLPIKTQLFEWVRFLSLRLAKFDPLATLGPKASSLILCKTDDTLKSLPSYLIDRSVIALEIGSPIIDTSKPKLLRNSALPFKLLFAGTLSGVKGIVMVIHAVRTLLDSGFNVILDIAGKGPLHDHIVDEIVRLKLTDHVKLLGMIPRLDLMNLYCSADLFVFPSLHDSSGNVVLESLSRGLPVVCLDLGGPKYYISPGCGVVVSTVDKNLEQVETGLVDAISGLIADPVKLLAMSIEAIKQAQLQTWESRVSTAYDLIDKKLGWSVDFNNY